MGTTDWVESDSADNAVATATKAGVAGVEHFITAIIGSYDSPKSGLITVTAGGTTLFEVEATDELDIEFIHPVRGGEGNAVAAALDASGTGGTTGYIAIMGYSY